MYITRLLQKVFLCFFTTFSWSANISLENELYTDSLFLLPSPNVIFQFSFWNEIIHYLKIILPFFQSSSSSLMTKLPLMSHFVFFFFSDEGLHLAHCYKGILYLEDWVNTCLSLSVGCQSHVLVQRTWGLLTNTCFFILIQKLHRSVNLGKSLNCSNFSLLTYKARRASK